MTNSHTQSRGVFERVYVVVKMIPRGKVATYRDVASLAGNPRWARVVGYALHSNPYPFSFEKGADNSHSIPCHRVVFSDGRLSDGFAFGGSDVQRADLESEGVRFTPDGKVDLQKYGWGRS